MNQKTPTKDHLETTEMERDKYVLRDDMTDEDVAYNVARLRKQADDLLRHADALRAWHASRKNVPGREG